MFKMAALLVLLSQFLWTESFAPCPTTEELTTKLVTPVHDYDLVADNFVDGLGRVARKFSVPMGITWVNAPPARTPFTLHWKEATVEKILATVVQTQPGYEMQISNGVVHISSTTISPEQNFLLLRIRTFVAHHEVVQMAQRELRLLVQSTVAPPKAGRGGIAGSLITNVGEPKIDIDHNDATVQDILDAIATASAKKIWVVTFSADRVPTVTGFRRTLTLWNNYPIPDEQQPLWDMFGWDESIPSARLAQQ
jgi:hypothetical protein